MAKKKSSTPADDLIKSLLDDVKEYDSSSVEDYPVEESEVSSEVSKEISAETKNKTMPAGMLPEKKKNPNQGYSGPSAGDGAYQAAQDVFAPPAAAQNHEQNDDKTAPIQKPETRTIEKTLAVVSSQERRSTPRESEPQRPIKVAAPSVMIQVDASLVQAENLKIAQLRLLELEKEVDSLRQENEEVTSAAEVVRSTIEQVNAKIYALEKERSEIQENSKNEIAIIKGQLQFKDSELAKAQNQIQSYEDRIKNDFKKVRVRERELENRLELLKAEKTTLVKSKDDSILELKRKTDQLQNEIDNYRDKCLELNKTLESHKEQFKRTVRALKLALTNLEVREEEAVPLKKAE